MKKVTKRYDQYGNLLEEIVYDEQGNILERTVYEYEEDETFADPKPFVFPKLSDVPVKEPEEIPVWEDEDGFIPQEDRGSNYYPDEGLNGCMAVVVILIGATVLSIILVNILL